MRAPSSYTDDLRLAHILADSVDGLTMKRFKSQDLTVETKPDLTPVTDADREAEQVIRAQLGRVRNRDAVIGEEFGTTGSGGRQWVIDPIDGTKNYVRGVPVWATLIGLIEDGEVVLGVVSAPALNRRWWAAAGSGAFTGRSLSQATRLSVSSVNQLSDASLSYSSLSGWRDLGVRQQFIELTDSVWRTRAYGDFWSYMLLAEGGVDLACEPELELYDMAAPSIVVTEAGGAFTDLDGVPGPRGVGGYASNGRLHEDLLARLTPRAD